MCANNGMTALIRYLVQQGKSGDEICKLIGDRYARDKIRRVLRAVNVTVSVKRPGPPPKNLDLIHQPRSVGELVEVAPGHFMRPEWATYLGYAWRPI